MTPALRRRKQELGQFDRLACGPGAPRRVLLGVWVSDSSFLPPPPLRSRRRSAQGSCIFLSEASFVPLTPHTSKRFWSWGSIGDRHGRSSCVLFTLSESRRGSEAVSVPGPNRRSFAETISFFFYLVECLCSTTASKRVLCCDTSGRFSISLTNGSL